jgi:hypothetical protein
MKCPREERERERIIKEYSYNVKRLFAKQSEIIALFKFPQSSLYLRYYYLLVSCYQVQLPKLYELRDAYNETSNTDNVM